MNQYGYSFRCMASPCELTLCGEEQHRTDRIAQTCIREARRFEQKYSRYLDHSITSQINSAAGQHSTDIDQETHAILSFAGVCYAQSGGLFDITSGVLRRVWNKHIKSLPEWTELKSCLDLIGWSKVDLSDNSIYLPMKGMELDFGGVVKEYAVDALTVMAKKLGIVHGLINLGGDIGIIGPRPGGEPWPIGIVHPQNKDTAIATIELTSGAITTSGGYERYFEIDGTKYSHLVNPKTGWPVESLQSVTIAADKAIVAGSISSIALLKNETESLDWLQASGAAYLAIDNNLRCYGFLAD